ncbi:MAG: glycine-rich domain-containing protein, partial [Candidatus Micrarchaeia archaeon]
MARRGQGATEYLVIFGAVLLVSAIVVSAIGATSGTDASVKMQQASAAWKGASPFAITSFKLSSSDIALAVSDSMKKELELTQVVFGDGADAIDLWAPSGSATQSFFAGTYSTTLSNSSFGVPGNPCYGKPVGTSFEFGSVTFVYADGSISGIRQVGPALSGQCSANASVSGAQPAGATPSPSAGATSTPTPTPSVAATPSPTPTPSPSPSPAPYAMLSGWVRDANGAGVSGAVVNLTNSTPSQPAVANASGYYSLNVSLGAQSAVFAASVSANFSYTPSAAVLSFAAGSPASRDFTLGFQNASIHGMVSDANGDAVSGANVSWGAYSAVTAANGNYLVSGIVMAGLSSSDTMVVSKSPVYSPRSLDVSVSAGSASVADFNSMYSRELDFVSSAVTGYVRDPSSAGISGVNVSCGDYFSSTAGDGLFAISGIAMSNATSACTLNASKFPTFNSNLTNVSLSAGGTSAQDLRLSYANASVSGFIRDGSSAGVSGATVSCGAFSTASTSDGSYGINGITMSSASSSCTLAASKSGYTSNSTTVSLTAGAATSSQNLVLNLIVNGVCGPANGFGRASIPSGADACSAGTVSAVSGSNPWSWFCNGSYGGTNASCATINATYTPTVTSFTTVGTTTWTVPAGVSSVDYLVVAGGGGGGGFRGGGGGGGGFRTASGYPVTSGTAYTITVGAGGAGGAATSPGGYGYAGSNSSFYTVVSIGGGFGGDAAGGNGGSGGGGSTTSGGSGTSGQGNDGGSGSTACGTYSIGGGGGGASGTGIATVECVAGGGGAGASSSINGSAITYAGGGGGGTRCGYTPGSGGSGGGGSGGAQANGVAGTNGLGGGGGGGGRCDGAQTYAGAAGGSGIVILRYVIVTNGSCGSSNGQNLYSAPSTNLCSVGSASSVSGSGPWSWTCSGSNGGASTSCSANLAVNGVCGSSNGAGFYSVPTTNFCSAGSASVVSG